MLLNVSIISSKAGGTAGEVDAYDRETTIDRIQQAIEALVSEHVAPGQISKVKARVKGPRRKGGVQTTTLLFRVEIGTVFDLDRAQVIRACQAEVPHAVTTKVPADHLCSLVIALKGS